MSLIVLHEDSKFDGRSGKVVYIENGNRREMDLIPASEVDENLPFPVLNPLQTLFHEKYGEGSALVSTPTSSGKTVVAIDFMKRHRGLRVYIVPTKALAEEIHRTLQKIFGRVDLRTGDVMEDYLEIKSSTVVATYESFVLSLRNRGWGYRAGSLVIDEIHHVFSGRGNVVEEAVAMMRDRVPILGLSATLPRDTEIADWIGARLHIRGNWRPVPIVKKNHNLKKGQSLEESLLEFYLKQRKGDELTIIFVYKKEIGWNLLRLVYEKGYTIANRTLPFTVLYEEEPDKYDFAFHNADIPVQEKHRIEKLFREGRIRALIATQTLAYGINLPADRVIILMTSYYDRQRKKKVVIPSPTDILQMEGRAGRFGIKEVGYVDLLMYRTSRKTLDQASKEMFEEGITEIMESLQNIESLFADYLGPAANLSSFVLSAYQMSRGEVYEFLKNTFSFRHFDDYAKIDLILSYLKERGYIEGERLTEKGEFALHAGIPPTALEEFLSRMKMEGNLFVKIRPLLFSKRIKGCLDPFMEGAEGYTRLYRYTSLLAPFDYPADGSLELLFYIHGEMFFLPNIHNPPSELYLYSDSIHLAKHLMDLTSRGYIITFEEEVLRIAHSLRYGLELEYAPIGGIKGLGYMRTNALKIALKEMGMEVNFTDKVEKIARNLDINQLMDVLHARYRNERIARRELNNIMKVLRENLNQYLLDEGIMRRLALLKMDRDEALKKEPIELYRRFIED